MRGTAWVKTLGSTLEDLQENDRDIPVWLYIRSTTKKDGRERAMYLSPLTGKHEACFLEEMSGPVSWEFSKIPERLIYVVERSGPYGVGELQKKPLIWQSQDNVEVWFAESESTYCALTRWSTCLEYHHAAFIENQKYTCEVVTNSPHCKNHNYKIGKGNPKSSGGIIFRGKYNYDANSYDNRYIADKLPTLRAEKQSYYVPYQNLGARWSKNVSLKPQGLAINWPITGFFPSIKLALKPQPRLILDETKYLSK
jgi:hypothetical protein